MNNQEQYKSFRSEYHANQELRVAANIAREQRQQNATRAVITRTTEQRRAYSYQLQARAAATVGLFLGARPRYWAGLALTLIAALS